MFLLYWFDLIRIIVKEIVGGIIVQENAVGTIKEVKRINDQNTFIEIDTDLYHYIIDVYELDYIYKRKYKFINHNNVDVKLAEHRKSLTI